VEFIKVLVPTQFAGENNFELSSKYRQFEPISIKDGYWLSIQGSYAHYCTPRITSENLNDYTHWEMALFNDNEFVQVNDVLPNFKSLAEIEHYFDSSIYPYVPVDLIEELYTALRN